MRMMREIMKIFSLKIKMISMILMILRMKIPLRSQRNKKGFLINLLDNYNRVNRL